MTCDTTSLARQEGWVNGVLLAASGEAMARNTMDRRSRHRTGLVLDPACTFAPVERGSQVVLARMAAYAGGL